MNPARSAGKSLGKKYLMDKIKNWEANMQPSDDVCKSSNSQSE